MTRRLHITALRGNGMTTEYRALETPHMGSAPWVPETGWQPSETAPTDGTEFQAWVDYRGRGIWEPRCRYDQHGAFQIWQRVDYDCEDWDTDSYAFPTHWMPQPEPPTLRAVAQEDEDGRA